MKNKIMIMVLLCALLVGLVPPSSAKAEEVDVDRLCVEACEALLNDSSMADILASGRQYAIGYSDYTGYVSMILAEEDSSVICIKTWNNKVYLCTKLTGQYHDRAYLYQYIDGVWIADSSGALSIQNNSTCPVIVASNYDSLYDKNGNVVYSNIPTIFEYIEGYSFVDWCDDANLNCQASSYESSLVVPYSYNEYLHIVRRTGTGKYDRWILTTIGNSIIGDNLSDYTLMVDDTGELQVFALYSGEEEQGYQLFVRNYVYDTDGWKLISFELFDTREDDDFIIELGEDSAINDVNLLAYTSVDIYDDGLNLLHSASTEYYDVNDILPDVPEQPEEPSITPTVPPSSGGSVSPLPTVAPPISAGQATVTENRTGVYEEPQDSTQLQHYLHKGQIVYVIEEINEDWYYVRYEAIGVYYTGYIKSSRVSFDAENGYASEDITNEVVLQAGEVLGMISVVPMMIASLFSFLPSWCLTVVGLSFTLLVGIVIYKALRG